MLDAHLAHIVEIEDVVLVGELAALLGLGRALDVLVGNEVVEDDGDVLFVEHAVEARLFELVDGDGGSDVIAQHDVELGVDELARLDLGEARVCGQNFLRLGHSHDGTLLFILACSLWSVSPLSNLSAACGVSSPGRGASGETVYFAGNAKASPR